MSIKALDKSNSAPNKASTRKVLESSLANKRAATDLVNQMGSHYIAALIVATSVSQTTDFAALKVGDMVAMIPATAGNADAIGPIATAGDLGQAAVVGNMYLVLRANSI